MRNFIDLIIQKTRADLRTEAARGYLGVLWWIIEPILYMGAFYVIFATVHRGGDKNFVKFLIVGLISWKWFHSTILVGASSLIANANLMNQVYIHKIVFPITAITVNTVKFLIVLILLLFFLYFQSGFVLYTWIFLPPVFFAQLFLITAVTSFFSAIMPFFPDFRGILENIMLMIFFLSGIFYEITNLSIKYQKILKINPIAFLISSYRDVLLYGNHPNWYGLIIVSILSFFLFCTAYWLLTRYDRIYPKIIFF